MPRNPKSARVGNRGNEFGAGDASHAGQDDGIPAVKQVANSRGQMTAQIPCLLRSGCEMGPPACEIPIHPHEPASLVQDHCADHESAKQKRQRTDCVSSYGLTPRRPHGPRSRLLADAAI